MFIILLQQHFIHVALLAAGVAAVVAGSLSPLVIARGQAFSVHGIAELGLTGAAGGLLAGLDAATGALIGSMTVGALLGVLGLRERDRDAATGVVLAAGLGLGVLFLSRLNGYATTGFGLLFGSITSVSSAQLRLLLVVGFDENVSTLSGNQAAKEQHQRLPWRNSPLRAEATSRRKKCTGTRVNAVIADDEFIGRYPGFEKLMMLQLRCGDDLGCIPQEDTAYASVPQEL